MSALVAIVHSIACGLYWMLYADSPTSMRLLAAVCLTISAAIWVYLAVEDA